MAMKCEAVFSTHERAMVSISGGADSDVMLDLCERVRTVTDCEVAYVFLDTGLEYRATREHIRYLEDRYDVEVIRRRSLKTIPVCARQYGQPFVSKMVSYHVALMQRGGFGFEDGELQDLIARYPRVPPSTLRWWCDGYAKSDGSYGSYCIGRNRWLKEFLIANPPGFRVSAEDMSRGMRRLF